MPSVRRRFTTIIGWWVFVGFGSSMGLADERQVVSSPSPSVPEEWLTKAERTGFEETPRYEETVAYCRRLAEASSWLNVQSFGVSPEGRELVVVVASKDQAVTPQAAWESGKLIVLVQNAIHPGECDGKDASLMLLRDIAVLKSRDSLLDQVILLVIPIFNVDGHERFSPYSRINQNGPKEMGWRVTSRNLNLNRDYMKADAVEMRAWLKLWNEWQPHFHIDNHTTDGGDWRYDITFDADTHATAAPAIARWVKDRLFPHLFSTLPKQGHVPTIYFDPVDWRDPSKGIRSSGFPPRFSTGYVALRNRPSLLVEMHALKPYRTRVIGNYNLMVSALELLNREPDSLREAARRADQEVVVAMGNGGESLVLSVKNTEKNELITFKGVAVTREPSDISGATRTEYDNTRHVDTELPWFHETEAELSITPPRGYVIPAPWTEVLDLLDLHGVRYERLSEPAELSLETLYFAEVTFADRPFEGRIGPRFKLRTQSDQRTIEKGAAIVRLDQPNAKVAVHLLEPEGPDSLVRWGFFNAVFEQKEYAEGYALEKLARQMLDADPKLKAEFEEKVRSDEKFAADPRARLTFFYQRSPFWDERLNRYPVMRIVGPITTDPKARFEASP